MADFRRLLDSDTDESDFSGFSDFDSSSSDESSLSGESITFYFLLIIIFDDLRNSVFLK